MDETGFAYDPKPNKTVHLHGERNVLSISSGSKAQVTVIACVSATGNIFSSRGYVDLYDSLHTVPKDDNMQHFAHPRA